MNATLVLTGISRQQTLVGLNVEDGYDYKADFNTEYGVFQSPCLDDLNVVSGTSRIAADRRRQRTAVPSLCGTAKDKR